MAGLAAARPVSQQFDVFASSSSSSSNHRRVRSSHYRPFSTLYTESPYIDIDDKARKRASTLGGLQNMSFFSMSKASQLAHKLRPSEKPATPQPIPQISLPRRPLRKRKSMASIRETASLSDTASSDAFMPSPEPAAFVPLQNVWAKRHDMKLHPYGSEAVYMQAYDPILLENDRYSDTLLKHLSNGSPSFYDYGKRPPPVVLDLGCGQGHWVLNAASLWKTSKITGFDLVDITLPAFETTENVQFVQGNFIKYKLPFEDESFDYVRMANLGLCIPHIEWTALLTEVRRVLRARGRLEIIDDEILFPYADFVPQPKPSNPLKPQNRSAFDVDSDDDFDSDTLQGEGSEEGSTLNNDHSNPSSYKENHFDHSSPLSASETVRPLARHRVPSPNPYPYKKPIITDPYLAQSNNDIWRQRVKASRELECTFLSMLVDPDERHWVHPWPSHIVLGLMQQVFGGNYAGKTKSFKIKVAEWDSQIGLLTDGAIKEIMDWSNPAESAKKKTWMNVEWDKKEKKSKEEKSRDKEKKEKGGSSGSASERSSLETPIPTSLKPKAARQLGLDLSDGSSTMKPSSFKDKISAPALHSPQRSGRLPTPIPNAKAAGVFGIPYTELVAATALATSRGRRGVKPLGLVQSPGLQIGDRDYLPLDPLELEMHACKWIHTLIGCRPALERYVAKFVDQPQVDGKHATKKTAEGVRWVDDEMLAYLVAEYEAFRRLRFRWPSNPAEPFEEDLLNEPPPASVDTTACQADKPVHIRTIRVFQALKS